MSMVPYKPGGVLSKRPFTSTQVSNYAKRAAYGILAPYAKPAAEYLANKTYNFAIGKARQYYNRGFNVRNPFKNVMARMKARKARPINRRRSTKMAYSGGARNSLSSSYRKKRGSRKAYRRHLWNSSKFVQHHRSIYGNNVATITTPATADVKTFEINYMVRKDFWTPTGGFQGTGTFSNGDLTIRGGRYVLGLYNPSTVPLRVDVTQFFTKQAPERAIGIPASVKQMWDMTQITDFELYYKIGQRRTILIEPGQRHTMYFKLQVQKIDQTLWDQFIKMPMIGISVHAPVDGAYDLNYTRGFSLSFVGDQV